MEVHERYMQKHFQHGVDMGVVKDETHKFSNSIRLQGQKGKVYPASTTIMSQVWLINLNLLCYTKSHEEI